MVPRLQKASLVYSVLGLVGLSTVGWGAWSLWRHEPITAIPAASERGRQAQARPKVTKQPSVLKTSAVQHLEPADAREIAQVAARDIAHLPRATSRQLAVVQPALDVLAHTEKLAREEGDNVLLARIERERSRLLGAAVTLEVE